MGRGWDSAHDLTSMLWNLLQLITYRPQFLYLQLGNGLTGCKGLLKPRGRHTELAREEAHPLTMEQVDLSPLWVFECLGT